MVSRNAESLALIKSVVPDIYNVLGDACFRICPVLVLHLVRKFTVKALGCGLCLM